MNALENSAFYAWQALTCLDGIDAARALKKLEAVPSIKTPEDLDKYGDIYDLLKRSADEANTAHRDICKPRLEFEDALALNAGPELAERLCSPLDEHVGDMVYLTLMQEANSAVEKDMNSRTRTR